MERIGTSTRRIGPVAGPVSPWIECAAVPWPSSLYDMLARLRSPDPARQWLLAIVGVWAAELMLVQELTLAGAAATTFWSPVHGAVRLVLDLLMCMALVHLLPTLALGAVQVLAMFFFWTVLAYHAHYLQALSMVSVLSNLREGMQVAGGGLSVLAAWHYGFAITLLIKTFFLFRARGHATPPLCREDGTRMMSLYVGVLVAAQFFGKPLTKIAGWETVGGVGRVYGYLPSWGAELIFFDNARLLTRALQQAAIVEDSLRPNEVPLEIDDHLVFLQVESLDQAVLGFEVGGREVTPNLNRLAQTSMMFAVSAPKKAGSCDADFQAIMGMRPGGDVPNYKIPGFPYHDSLPHRLRARGWETMAVHGVSGRFFNRRAPFTKMGFDRVVFLEELEAKHDLNTEDWAIFDHELLEHAGEMLNPKRRQFQLVITVTSHVPFRHIPALDTHFTNGSSVEDRYFDVIHYVDRAVGAFAQSLPPNTVVVIYGDHTSRMEHPDVGYHQQVRNGVGVVPFMIHHTGRDLGGLQRVTGERATSGELTLLDGLNYVHHYALLK